MHPRQVVVGMRAGPIRRTLQEVVGVVTWEQEDAEATVTMTKRHKLLYV